MLGLRNLNEMSQQPLAPPLPLPLRGNAKRKQMRFFRSDCHHPITKKTAALIQYNATVTGIDGIAEIASRPGKKENLALNGNHRVQVGQDHSPDRWRIIRAGAHRSFSFRATLLRI